MKKLLINLLIFISLFTCCKQQQLFTEKKYECGLIDSTTRILSVVFADNKNHRENDLIIIGLIKNNEFIPIDDYDDQKNTEINERDSILREVKSFYIVNEGNVNIKIDTIINATYDCNELKVGRFLSKNAMKDISIASNYTLPCSKQFEIINKNCSDSLYNRIVNDSIFQDINQKFTNIDFNIIKFQDNDNILCIVNAEDSLKAISNLYFLKDINSSLYLTNFVSDTLTVDSWGRGNKFLDYLDVDNDKTPELFLLYSGYESNTIIVFKRIGDKYIKKLENTIFGC